MNRSVRVSSRIVLVLALSSLVASAVLAGCAAKPTASATPTSAQPATPPTLSLTAPQAGAEVPAGTVPVSVQTTGLKYAMPSNTNVPGEGHVHFTLDDRPFIMSTEPDAEINDVTPGEHKLVAELVQNNTQSFDPPIKQEITFSAK